MMVRTTSNDGDLLARKASFIQHARAGLDPGLYQIQVEQHLATQANPGTNDPGKDISGGLPSIARTFGVSGPGFTLPQTAIHSVFPPANSAGAFSTSLAHVVLETETLPWQRSPFCPLDEPSTQVRSYSTVINGISTPVDYDEDKATWLAVLLVSPSDLGGQDPSRQIVQGTTRDLIPASLSAKDASGTPQPGTLPANAYSTYSYLLEPPYGTPATIDPGLGRTIADPVQYIDLPCALFDAIAPSTSDLRMMAHVRAVRMDQKPLAAGQSVDPEERYALVLGNRLPESQPPDAQTGDAGSSLGANVALLVSLESMARALRSHTPGNPYDTRIASQPDGVVRLVVLYQWRFTSWEDTTFEFVSMLEGLNGRDAAEGNSVAPLPNPLFRVPDPPASPGGSDSAAIVRDMLASGYFPHDHVTRMAAPTTPVSAVQTVSWYRGPLIPPGAFIPPIEWPLVYTADQLLRCDPNVGLFDVSYAAAWELGRLLSLSNKDFSVPLYRWKCGMAMKYRVLMEKGMLAGRYDGQALHARLLQHLVARHG